MSARAGELTADQAALARQEIKRRTAEVDFLYFLGRCRLKVRRSRTRPAGFQRFAAWEHQQLIGRHLQAGDSMVILKARQLGVSWVLAAYVLWVALYRPYSLILLLSMDQKTSDELLNKVYTMWDNLPAWLPPEHKEAVVRLTKHTRSKPGLMEFSNGSMILALPSTEDAGRSFTADLVIADEAPFHAFAEANFGAYEPTLDGDPPGQLVLCGTANGPHGLFYDQWQSAVKHASDLVALFVPWWSRPDRQQDKLDADGNPILDGDGNRVTEPSERWLARTKGRYQRAMARFRREYPATPGDAFSASMGLVYGMRETDGFLVFNPAMHPNGNIAEDPCRWEDCQWHFGYVDWGGGDPTAAGIIGVTSSGRIHQFAEWHWADGTAPGTELIGDWFIKNAPRPNNPDHGYDSIECGKDEPNSIKALRDAGLPAVSADADRTEGISLMTGMLEQRRFTFNPKCENAIAEFDAYYWDEKTDQRTGTKSNTKTPSWTHGDHKDGERYVVMKIVKLEGGLRDDYDVPAFVLSPGSNRRRGTAV